MSAHDKSIRRSQSCEVRLLSQPRYPLVTPCSIARKRSRYQSAIGSKYRPRKVVILGFYSSSDSRPFLHAYKAKYVVPTLKYKILAVPITSGTQQACSANFQSNTTSLQLHSPSSTYQFSTMVRSPQRCTMRAMLTLNSLLLPMLSPLNTTRGTISSTLMKGVSSNIWKDLTVAKKARESNTDRNHSRSTTKH